MTDARRDTHMELRRDVDGSIVFCGRFNAADLLRIRLDPFDRALLDDCGAEGRTAADWLLALEMLFRRAREQAGADAIARGAR
jgi:hypothetical protein